MRRIAEWITAIGCIVVVLSLGLLLLMTARADQARRNNEQVVTTMLSLLPERTAHTKDPLWDATMPSLELEGEDYIALLEIPSYSLELPVGARWDHMQIRSHPCRFWGSAYNGSLIIGGADQAGQFDFFDQIHEGTRLILTDMAGRTFTYTVERVERSDTADAEVLMKDSADLTLFVRDARLLQYIILRCTHGA